VRALVTGGRGFAGSWLAKALLEAGSEVSSLDREGASPSGLDLQGIAGDVNDVVGDLRDGELVGALLRDRSIDAVFHLAAQAIVGDANASPVPTFQTNIEGTWVVLEAAREAGVGLAVVASSDKAYGPHEELPYTEDSALQPVFPYDVSKAATDLIARSYWHTYGFPVAITRFANLYGGGDRNFSRLVPETVTAVLDGRSPVIRSDGSPERDFLYIEDAAQAYLTVAGALASGRAGGEAFNAGWGRPHPVREVIDLICELGPDEVEPDYRGTGNPSGEIDRQYLDSTKIREQLGWEPAVALREVRPAAAAS
jgi:CDP-glucose 4,6-dehydratase